MALNRDPRPRPRFLWARFLDDAFDPASIFQLPAVLLEKGASPMKIKPEDCPNIKRIAESGFYIRSPHDIYLSKGSDSIIRMFPTVAHVGSAKGFLFVNPDQVGDYDSDPRYYKINTGILFEPVEGSCLLMGPSDPRLVNRNLFVQPALVQPGYKRQLAAVVTIVGEGSVKIARGDVIAQILPFYAATPAELVEQTCFDIHQRAAESAFVVDASSNHVDIPRSILELMMEISKDDFRTVMQSRRDLLALLSEASSRRKSTR